MSRPPHPKAPGVPLGVSEHLISALVHAFYARVRADDVLGPIFERHITDWNQHLEKLCDFWSSVVLMTGNYKGRPIPVHAAITGITEYHFERWLKLFADTARLECPPEVAQLFIDRSERIAASLRAGMGIQHDLTNTTRPLFT
jgi:hemoglobin